MSALPDRRRLLAIHLMHGALAGMLVGLVHLSGLTLSLDKRNYDLWFQLSPASDRLAEHVVIVAIDAKSLEDDDLGAWPWPSRRIGQLLTKIDQARPSAVGLDILLDRPRDETDPELARTLSRLRGVILAANLRSGADPTTPPHMEWPLPSFLRPHRTGFSNAIEDRPDGFVRSWQLAVHDGDSTFYSFPLLVALAAHGKRVTDTEVDQQWVRVWDYRQAWSKWPIVSIIDFRRPGRLPAFSAADVLKDRLPPQALSGKAVLVGGTAAGEFADVFQTPFFDDLPAGRLTPMHGVEILANAVETLLSGVRVREVTPLAVATVVLLFVVIACVVLRPLHLIWGVAVSLIMVIGSAAACLFLFISHHLQVPATPFVLGTAAAYLVVALEKHAAAEARRRLAEHKNVLLRDLSAMVTHDLKGPLTGIMGFLDLLSREQLEDHQREFVQIALGSSRWLSVLIAGILDVARLEAGQTTLHRVPLDIGDELQQALLVVSYQLQEKNLRMQTAVESDLPPVPADSELFRRIVVNLVGNAVKFAPAGSTIRLGASRDERRDAVVVHVQDEGPGIPREYQERIFDKFVQVAKGKTSEQVSVGLGLAFCRLAVDAHGGRIWVESAPGQGSTFSFWLPLEPV